MVDGDTLAGDADGDLINAVWEAAHAYRIATTETEAKAAFEDALGGVIGEESPGATVHAVKLTEAGRRNQFWQGKGNTEPHDVMAFLYALETGHEEVAKEARRRLDPLPVNGF